MKVIDSGHSYELDILDPITGQFPQRLIFVKREGERYPGNIGHHPGTNIQEVMRVIIDRFKYLHNQIPCQEDIDCINHARAIILLLENRAADRHGRHRVDFNTIEIEKYPTCPSCGHVGCNENCK